VAGKVGAADSQRPPDHNRAREQSVQMAPGTGSTAGQGHAAGSTAFITVCVSSAWSSPPFVDPVALNRTYKRLLQGSTAGIFVGMECTGGPLAVKRTPPPPKLAGTSWPSQQSLSAGSSTGVSTHQAVAAAAAAAAAGRQCHTQQQGIPFRRSSACRTRGTALSGTPAAGSAAASEAPRGD